MAHFAFQGPDTLLEYGPGFAGLFLFVFGFILSGQLRLETPDSGTKASSTKWSQRRLETLGAGKDCFFP